MSEKVEVPLFTAESDMTTATFDHDGVSFRFLDRGEDEETYYEHAAFSLCTEEVEGLIKEYLKRNPSLLSQVLSEEQKEALRDAIGPLTRDREYESARIIDSILTPKEA